MIKILSAAIASLLSLCLVAAPARADGLVDNVNGMTFDKEGQIVRFTGLVIDDNGKVKRLLDRRDKRPEKLDFKHDGEGRTLIPGFVDAHGHVMGLGFSAITLDLSGTRSLEEALAAVKAYAEANPARPWIIGRGWNQELWGLGRFPTAADLDSVVADRPVWLERVDGHAGWANSAAMTAAGIDSDTKAPSGGSIEKIGSKPSGIFVDKASSLVQRVVPEPRPADRDLALSKAQQILLKNGVTTITDMGTTLEDWQALRRAGDEGRLQMRVISYAAEIDNMVMIGGPRPTPWLYGDKLRMVGVKLYLDGALGSRGAWLKRPYADSPGNTGLALLTPAQLRNKITRAAMDGFQPAIHAIGDQANAELIAAIEEIAPVFNGDRRWRIEHAQILDPVDIVRLSQVGVIASMQPVHQTSDRLMAEARLGPDRLDGAYAWKSLIDGGTRIAFGTDVPVESSDPFRGLAAAMTREDANGQPFGGWIPEQRISREDALKAYTLDAAFAGFAEDKIGSLIPGHGADFLLLSDDIMLVPASDIRNLTVEETWVSGKLQFRRQ